MTRVSETIWSIVAALDMPVAAADVVVDVPLPVDGPLMVGPWASTVPGTPFVVGPTVVGVVDSCANIGPVETAPLDVKVDDELEVSAPLAAATPTTTRTSAATTRLRA